MSERKLVGINVWKKDSGNMLSHGSGLTAEQIEMLKNLQPGDRLMVVMNNKAQTESSHCAFIKVYTKDFSKKEF